MSDGTYSGNVDDIRPNRETGMSDTRGRWMWVPTLSGVEIGCRAGESTCAEVPEPLERIIERMLADEQTERLIVEPEAEGHYAAIEYGDGWNGTHLARRGPTVYEAVSALYAAWRERRNDG